MYYDISLAEHEDKYAEVELIDATGKSHIYWFKRAELPDNLEEEEDLWMIEQAKIYHYNITGDQIPEDQEAIDFEDAHALFLDDPFSRDSSEFKFVPIR